MSSHSQLERLGDHDIVKQSWLDGFQYKLFTTLKEVTTNQNAEYQWLTYDRLANILDGYLGNWSLEYLLVTNPDFKAV